MAQVYARDQPAGFTNRIERIAIIGAGGSVGQSIAAALLSTGKHSITALTRADSTTRLPSGIKSVPVDYSDESTLIAALQGKQALIITLSVHAPPDTHHKIVVAAAKAGVKYVMPNVYSWYIENNETLKKESLVMSQVEEYTRDIEVQGVSSWIALACSFWYEYSLSGGYWGGLSDLYGLDFIKRKATFYADGKTRANATTWDQCGRAVAALFSLKELPDDEGDEAATVSSWKNKPLRVTSFYVSQREMLDSIHRVLGTTDKDWEIEHVDVTERYRKGLEVMMAGDRVGFGRALYARPFFPDAGNDEDHFASAAGVANEVLGLPKEDLDEATKKAIDMGRAKNKV